jgi:hypothetical protein
MCGGFLTDDPDYKVTENGTLVRYTSPNETYYELYNDFCVDIDSTSGNQIVIICNNQKTIRKCCEKTLKLMEVKTGHFQCRSTKKAVLLNDLSKILWENSETKPNLEFEPSQFSNFGNSKLVTKFDSTDFLFDENQTMVQYQNETEFCLDKLNEKWILLVEKKIVESAFIVAARYGDSSVVGLISFVSIVLIFLGIWNDREVWLAKKLLICAGWSYIICLTIALLLEAIHPLFGLYFQLARDLFFLTCFFILPAILLSKLFEGIDKFYKAIVRVIFGAICMISTVCFTLSYSLENSIGKFYQYFYCREPEKSQFQIEIGLNFR